MYSTILHPTDLSDSSAPALRTAHELADKLGSKLIVCFIAPSPMVAAGDVITDPKKNESRNIAEELESIQPSSDSVQRELRIIIAESSTQVKTMLGFLEEMDCDLLVVGMHNRAGIAGWIRSSITEEVVRRANCPVLVVKHHEYDFDATE